MIVPTWKTYIEEGGSSTLISYKEPNIRGESLYVAATVLNVNFSDKKYTVNFAIQPNGTLANEYGQLNQQLTLKLSSFQIYHFESSEMINPIQATFNYEDGNQIDYPFDIYVGRSTTTLVFSIFICILMWLLSLLMGLFAYQVVFQKRKADAHGCMIGITTLFALPAIRSAQPGIPDVGTVSDILGFYWNIAIIACSSIAIIIFWVIRWNESLPRGQNSRNASLSTFVEV
ncbi:hypothetical protein RO3G_16567 [Rhizopus delemar RA 99-880]|uniref:Uncharacterized protein n=1 Tax=Rhizopus delemar (strain RA 99-880 / ATCC MYA-4621 / FGSC 9543 / NRRL 43880) TaxID=246409 RepID=I1CTS6_RHIO9|nr:hypothetical protein RO3G_16567 [Rhizopus delemar RA 99-880]|eukprot:EIE91856.1 hypothetical protein RO3G_16567 [Rhizopus delemar RA 99-880]